MTKKTEKKSPMKVVGGGQGKTTTASGTEQPQELDFGITSDEALKNLQLSLSEIDDLKKYKLCLIYADWNASTGFGMVMKKLMEEWIKKEDYMFFIVGINDMSSNEYDAHDRIYVFPALPNKDNDVFGRLKFLHKLSVLDVDTVFMLNDPEILNQLGHEMYKINRKKKQAGRKTFKSIAYFPVDSPIRKVDANQLGYYDEIITYTNYAKRNVEKVLSKAKDVKVVPHGIDSNEFYKISDDKIESIRKKLFGKNHHKKFVVGSVNRNQVRKDIGGLIKSFYHFKKNIPESVLYLHMNPKDPVGVNINRVCSRLGLDFGIDVICPKDFNENSGVTIQELNEIYNVFDVFVTTTTAEGWGLTISEAMATSTPVICPLHTSIPEVTGINNVYGFNYLTEMFFVGDYEKLRYVSDPFVVYAKLIEVYSLYNGNSKDKKKLNKKVHEAKKLAISRNWSDIAEAFLQMFV